MTQQTTWPNHDDPAVEAWQWMLMGPEGTYPADAMQEGMDRLNDAVRDVAATTDAHLYDLAAAIPPTLEHFCDDVHFNVEGARVAGEGLAQVIEEAGLVGR